MEYNKIKTLYAYIKKYHDGITNSEDRSTLDFTGKLSVTLRNYQEKAVKWMIFKERSKLHTVTFGFDVLLPRGGVLADEMGLGKTVEVLSCILSNPMIGIGDGSLEMKKLNSKRSYELDSECEPDDFQPNSSSSVRKKRKTSNVEKKSGIFSDKYTAMRNYYEAQLSSCSTRTPVIISKSQNIKCFCDNNKSDKLDLLQCEDCGIWQHAECLGIENNICYGNIKCPQCWSKSKNIQTKATLIITPPSILEQWTQEIDKHVCDPEFKYQIYNGIKHHNYVQPTTFSTFDVILTTYNILCSELDFLPQENVRKLRHSKKYFSPTSPLTCVTWWRICLDEAQMVEGYTSKTAHMATRLDSVNRWAVTGTPIQKSVQDLFGLVNFLRIIPFTDLNVWQDLMTDEDEHNKFVAQIMWRSSKQDVLGALGVPPQTVLTHWLHFSPVEGYFYRTIHTECATAFRVKLLKFFDLDVKLSSIDRKALSSLMLPLLRVRQACTHPQVVRGKFVRIKHRMTMEELLKEMVTKARVDADSAMRQLVSSLHGIAAIRIIQGDYAAAVKQYRQVLHLNSQYSENTVKVDSILMIHCLYNLAEVLQEHGEGIPPTLRDSTLNEDAEELESKYLEKYSLRLQAKQETLAKHSASVAHQCQGATLSFTSWWEQLLNSSDIDDDDLLNKIKSYLDDNVVPGQQSITTKLTGLHVVYRELARWLADADVLREKTMDALRKLQRQPTDSLLSTATSCHIPKVKRKKGHKRCLICECEKTLKEYENHIFSVNKVNLLQMENEEEEEEEEGEEKKKKEEDMADEGKLEDKETKELKEVKIFRTNKESNWKPTSQERILQVLANYAKRVNSSWGRDGNKHVAIMESVRREFGCIRAVWRNISDGVYARDELSMAKLRLRLPLYDGEIGDNNAKSDIYIIEHHDVPLTFLTLQNDCIQGEAALKRTTGILLYLKNLQKSEGSEREPCPVCKESLVDKWSVLHCGHCFCFDCIPVLLKMSGYEIDCPLCRVQTPKESVSYVVGRPINGDDPEFGVIGSHSTKVTAVVSKLLYLIKEEPAVKILIFSTWEKVLDMIKDALVENNISSCRLASGNKHKNSLFQFKNGSVSVLLLPLKLGAKGLNLTEATHIFFVDPILNPSEELQAVGRIHRIGQTRPTFVHRFVISNTIEERMLSALDTTAPEEWAKENITLRKLNDIFILREENLAENDGSIEDELLVE